ncbi:MAG: DUF2252 family protein [Pseudomonadota bacterium]
MSKNFIVVIVVMMVSHLGMASSSCESGGRSWVEIDGSVTMALRSNACHYWSWAKDHTDLLPEELLSYEAVVSGDPHHENFSHIFSGGNRVYVLNDFDDVGWGPVFLDILKFLGVSRSVVDDEDKLSTQTIVEKYIQGLKDWDVSYEDVADGGKNIPKMLEEDYSVSEKKFAEDYLEKIDKAINGDDEFKEDTGLFPWSDLKAAQKDTFRVLQEEIFSLFLPEGYEVLDRANVVKLEGGGSAGLIRYLYYLKKKKKKQHIVEFKPISDPAVAIFNSDQAGPVERTQTAVDIYWPTASEDSGVYQVVGDDENPFFMRPRHKKYVDYSVKDFKENHQDFAELSYFIAYHLGQKHGGQLFQAGSLDAFLKVLEADTTGLVEKSQAFVAAYLDEASSRHKKK